MEGKANTASGVDDKLLSVENLIIEFQTERGLLRAVDGISFDIAKGQTLGVVGESGCGKSVTALSIMRLIASPGRVSGGPIRYRGNDLLELSEPEMRKIRVNKVSMIFQEPMTSLNPVFTTGEQVAEAVRLHQGLRRAEALQVAIEMFKVVGIPAPETRVHNYPHQMSGGMRQRVMIAMALACKPELLIADEPTTALDVTIQAQILELLRSLQADFGMSILLITHDLGVVAETCQNVVVMYAGQIVEHSDCNSLFAAPRHPYTAGLLRSIPGYDGHTGRLYEIPGMVPALGNLPEGCAFQERCQATKDTCRQVKPQLVSHLGGFVRCHFPLEAAHE